MDFDLLTEDILHELYINKKQTAEQIAKNYNVCKSTIYRRLKKYNIPIRHGTTQFKKGHITWNKGLKGIIHKNKFIDYKKAWLSGFLAGEGCFTSSYFKRKNRDVFQIALSIRLREDDSEVLEFVSQMFNNVGTLNLYSKEKVNKYDNANRNPVAFFRIANITDLYTKVVPILDEYPLLSKKKKDYEIWRKIIKLLFKTKNKKNSRNKIKPELIKLIKKLHEVKQYHKM